jgi:penicillin-binding protein 1A
VVGSGAPPQQPPYGQQQQQPQQQAQPNYGGSNDPEAVDDGWNDGGYQAPPPGARIYRDGDPSYGDDRNGPVPPGSVGEDGQAGVYQARPHRRNLIDRMFGG